MSFEVIGYLVPNGFSDWPGAVPALLKRDGEYYVSSEGGAPPRKLPADELTEARRHGVVVDCETDPSRRAGDLANGPIEFRDGHSLFVLEPEDPFSNLLRPYYRNNVSIGDIAGRVALEEFELGLACFDQKQPDQARKHWYVAGRAASRLLFPELATYLSYFDSGAEEREAVQLSAERIDALVRLWLPLGFFETQRRVGLFPNGLEVELQDSGEALWRGLEREPIKVLPQKPITRWEAETSSSQLRALDAYSTDFAKTLRALVPPIQARLWFCRAARENDTRSVWEALGDEGLPKLRLAFPQSWNADPPPLRFSIETLPEPRGAALAALAPLGYIALTRHELISILNGGVDVDQPDVNLDQAEEMVSRLFLLRPWSIQLRKSQALGGLLSTLARRLSEKAKRSNSGDQRRRRCNLIALRCFRTLVDSEHLSAKQIGDLSRAAELSRIIKWREQAFALAHRFVREFDRRRLTKLPLTPKDSYRLPADAFSIFATYHEARGNQSEAVKYFNRALAFYQQAARIASQDKEQKAHFDLQRIYCLLALARSAAPSRAQPFLDQAQMIASNITENLARSGEREFQTARIAFARFQLSRDDNHLKIAERAAGSATEKSPGRVTRWLLRMRIVAEDHERVDAGTNLAVLRQRALESCSQDRRRINFRYGYYLEHISPAAAAQHWLDLISSEETDNFGAADRLVTILENDPSLDLSIPEPGADSTPAGLWLWLQWKPDKVPDQLLDNLVQSIASGTHQWLIEKFAELLADWAHEEAPGSASRERFVQLSHQLNDRCKDDLVKRTRGIRLALLAHELERAANLLETAEKIHKTETLTPDPYLRFYRAELNSRVGRVTDAINGWRDLYLLDPSRIGREQLRRKYLDCIYRAVIRTPRHREDALRAFNSIIDESPAPAPALAAAGHLHLSMGNSEEAAQHYSRAIQIYAQNENGTELRFDPEPSFLMRGLINFSDNGQVQSQIESLCQASQNLPTERLADELLRLGDFRNKWVVLLQGTMKIHQRGDAANAIAHYFMGRAVALRLGVVAGESFEDWMGGVFRLYDGSAGLLAEFLSDAKGIYRLCFRALALQWSNSPPDSEPEVLRMLKDPRPVPRQWEALVKYVVDSPFSPDYYRQVRNIFRTLGHVSKDSLIALVDVLIREFLHHEATRDSNLANWLSVAREAADIGSREHAAMRILDESAVAKALWLPDHTFKSDSAAAYVRQVRADDGRPPLWVDGEAAQLSAAVLLGTDTTTLAQAEVEWDATDEGTYRCTIRDGLAGPSVDSEQLAGALLRRQMIDWRREGPELVLSFSSVATAILPIESTEAAPS